MMYLQTVNPHPTASQHSCVNSAADHRVHLHLSLPSITSLTAAVRLNLIMDEKGTLSLSLPECTERMRKTMMTHLNHTTLRQKWGNMCGTIWLSLCLLQTFVCLLSMSTTTCKTFKQSKTWNFEASENWAPLTDGVWTENRQTNLTKITSSMSFGLFLDALVGSGHRRKSRGGQDPPIWGLSPLKISLQETLCIKNNIMDIYLK